MKRGEVVVFGCLRAGFAGGMSLYDESEIYNPPKPSGPPLAKKHDPKSLDSVNRECSTHYTESRSASQPASRPQTLSMLPPHHPQ